MKPTIAFFGSSLVSAYWNGAATYYRGMIRALTERGFTLVRARGIGHAARRRVLAGHTYAKRAAQVDALLDQGVAT